MQWEPWGLSAPGLLPASPFFFLFMGRMCVAVFVEVPAGVAERCVCGEGGSGEGCGYDCVHVCRLLLFNTRDMMGGYVMGRGYDCVCMCVWRRASYVVVVDTIIHRQCHDSLCFSSESL